MAITSSAKKALRSAERKAVYNAVRKDAMKDVTKQIRKLVSEKKGKEAQALLPKAYQAIDKAVKTGYIKANAGARKKSRLSASVKKVK